MRRHVRVTAALLILLFTACNAGPDFTNFTSPGNGPGPITGGGGPSPAPGADSGTPAPDAGSGGTSSAESSPVGIFPPDNWWNTRIDDAPVDPRSDAYIASMGANDPLVGSWDAEGDGIPYVEVGGNAAKVPVQFWGYASESDPGPYPIPWDAPVDRGSDHHVIVVDRTNGWLYELFKGSRNSDGSWQASNGARWNLRTNNRRPDGWTSADAAGMAIFPGLVRWDEVQSGQIAHALRFAVNQSQSGYVWPASHASGSCALGSNCPPMGLRVRLKKSVDISPFSWRMQVVLRALQQYGMFVADNSGGTSWWLAGAPDPRWSDQEIHSLGAIKGSDFEVVAHGDIQAQ
jgi:hypothetical protein